MKIYEDEELIVENGLQDSISSGLMIWRYDQFVINEENIRSELIAQGVDYPDIVLVQAIIETGGFTSMSCLRDNNLFGLRNGDLSYMKFRSWTESIKKYKECAQSYEIRPSSEEDYLQHLKNMGYAENPLYIDVIRETLKNRRKN